MNIKLVTLLGAAVLAGGAAAATTARSAGNASTLDLAVDGRHATRTLVDAAPKHTTTAPNDSPGDTIVMHAPLLNQNGARIGTIDATFLTTAPGSNATHDGSEQLTATLRLPEGQIAVLGTVGAYARVTHVAIVGGTGRYADARGDVTAHFTPQAVSLHVSLS
jgi:hypothetical protein